MDRELRTISKHMQSAHTLEIAASHPPALLVQEPEQEDPKAKVSRLTGYLTEGALSRHQENSSPERQDHRSSFP